MARPISASPISAGPTAGIPIAGIPGAGRASRAGSTGATIAVAVAVLALPSAVLGFGTRFRTPVDAADTPQAIDPLPVEGTGTRLARALSLTFLGRAPLYTFTPAKNPNRPDRSVTVAVRLDSQALRTITVLGTKVDSPVTDSPVRIAQTGFNLGVARGYQNFAQDLPAAPPVPRRGDSDLSRYSLAAHGPAEGARTAGDYRPRSSHAFPGDRDGAIDLGSSYRVTRNLNLTAGIRYSQDRERLKPLTDGNQDNQAVYVGTQFSF